ncbi:putative ankyrin repeat protein RF_0381 [Cotesia glomerata]|uniref:putative ankyrin repeat protein RF_0381 n=1 Tax=Cotesia glomerata TaxID=32391 RepID=UPI001D010EA2|nr:putative ankyrin repeat protein RF_0381 [Cotesia glomerata]
MVRLLIDYGEDINATTECSLTALLITIQNNKFELVKILVSLAADINKKVYDGHKFITLIPLHQALQHPDGRIFKYLLDTKRVEKKDLQSAAVPAIHCSDSENKAEILLQPFSSDDYKYPESDSMVLNLAIIAKNQTVIDSFISRNDSNVSLMKWRGQYPIHRAVKSNNIDCIIRLLSLGAKIDIKDQLGRTALYYAAKKLNTSITFFLLRQGANILALNNRRCHRWLELNIIWHKT